MAVDTELALALSREFAEHICQSALWQEDKCTWQVVDTEMVAKAQPQRFVVADAGLYRGTSGIALFLFELYAVTGEAVFLETACGAIQYALQFPDILRTGVSATHGVISVAYTLARAWKLIGDQLWRRKAMDVLAPVFGCEETDRTFDFMFGAAGAIPAMITIASNLAWDAPNESAVRFGHHLLKNANRRPAGYSWAPVGGHLFRQDLTGLSHGASGPAVALTALYELTRTVEFRFAAERAMDYEDAQFDRAAANWPDHREGDLKNLALIVLDERSSYSARERARETLRRLIATPPPTKYTAYWCNGAPGIGLARGFAYAALGHDRYRTLGIAAAKTTAASLSSLRNYSLCHGIMGNVDALLTMSDWLRDSAELETGYETVTAALDAYGVPRQWPTGAEGGTPDSSLFIGTAGIGLTLLRLAKPEVPSVLLRGMEPRPPRQAESTSDQHELCARRREEAANYFAVTLEVSTREYGSTLGVDNPDECNAGYGPSCMRRALRRVVHDHPDSMTADAFVLEAELFDAEATAADWTARHLLLQSRHSVTESDFSGLTVGISPTLRVVRQRYEWTQWDGGTKMSGWPKARRRSLLIFTDLGRAMYIRLGVFGENILTLLHRPITVTDLADFVAAQYASRQTRERVLRTALAWYKSGVIDDIAEY